MKAVLIADDEPNLRLLVSMTLGADRCTLLEASDGDEAWALIQQHRPAVALLDVQMPGLTGLELARAIRADPGVAATHVILLTARAQAHDVSAGLAAGADRYITKPFSPRELLAVIEQVLSAP